MGKTVETSTNTTGKHGRLNFHNVSEWYLQNKIKGEVVDDHPPSDAFVVEPYNFVRFVVDEGL